MTHRFVDIFFDILNCTKFLICLFDVNRFFYLYDRINFIQFGFLLAHTLLLSRLLLKTY